MDIFERRAARPMLIGRDEGPFDSPDYIFELKVDGERCLAYLGNGETELVNRRDRRILPQFPELAELHRRIGARCILDGELIVGTGSKSDFEFIKQRALSKRPLTIERLAREIPVIFVALDILYLNGKQLTRLPLAERRQILERTVQDGENLTLSRVVAEQGNALFAAVSKQGLEGIVGKRLDSPYLMGKRTRDWVKIKHWLEDFFVVCGYLPPDKAAVASLILGQHGVDGGLVYKGRVILGARRTEFDQVRAQPVRAGHPFSAPPPEGKLPAVWLRPQLVCVAGFMCWTEGGRLRQPFFKRLAPEKRAREVVEPVLADALSCVVATDNNTGVST